MQTESHARDNKKLMRNSKKKRRIEFCRSKRDREEANLFRQNEKEGREKNSHDFLASDVVSLIRLCGGKKREL